MFPETGLLRARVSRASVIEDARCLRDERGFDKSSSAR
jgi:hypothetical protein